ncbi:glycosyltransferase family 8 protein [soil metagenome]
MSIVNFAICADRNIEPGLHVTLYSALKSLALDSRAVAHLFLKDYDQEHLGSLKSTVAEFNERCEIRVYDIDKIDLGRGRGFHGTMVSYARIFIADIVECERIIYLDADLIVMTDLTSLSVRDLGGAALAAVSHSTLKNAWSHENALLLRLGLSDDLPYFNAGVLLIDVDAWKKNQLTEKCRSVIRKHGARLVTSDQSVLNAALSDQFVRLPLNYNVLCYPSDVYKTEPCDAIYHLVGSPKPWDLMGEFLHRGYPMFRKYLSMTNCKEYSSFRSLSVIKIERTLRLSRAYFRLIRSRLKDRRHYGSS